MSIQILGNDFFNSPVTSGLISSKTAELFMAEGDKLATKIEQQSTVSEAKALAPKVTQAYSAAYQKIAAGDMTGFADMQQARTMSIGNPILMKTMDEADQLAGKLAGEWMQTQRSQMGVDKSMELAKFSANKQSDLQDRIDTRADRRLQQQQEESDAREGRLERNQNENTARQLYTQERSAWDKENFYGQKQYEESMKRYSKQMDAYEEQKKLGDTTAQPPEKPTPFTPRPEPKFEDFLPKGSTAPAKKPVAGQPGLDITDLPGQLPASAQQPAAPAQYLTVPSEAGAQPTVKPAGRVMMLDDMDEETVPMELNPGQVVQIHKSAVADAQQKGYKLVSNAASSPTANFDKTAAPLPSQNLPEVSPNPPQFRTENSSKLETGKMPGEEEMSSDVLRSVGGTTIRDQVSQKRDAGKEPTGLLFGASPSNGTSLNVNIRVPAAKLDGVKVDTESGSVQKSYKMTHDEEKAADLLGHFADKENLSQWMALQITMGHPVEATYAHPENPKDKSVIFRTGTDTFTQKVTNADGTVSNKPILYTEDDLKKWDELRGLASKGIVEIKANPIPQEYKDDLRNKVVDMVAKNPNELASANERLQRLGVQPVTAGEVKTVVEKMNAPATNAKQAHWDDRLSSEIQSLGVKVPKSSTDPLAALRKERDQKADEFNQVKAERDALVQKYKGQEPPAADLEKLKSLQGRFIVLQDWLGKHEIMDNPTVSF